MSDLSTRVNSARLPDYVGKTVRLACKPLQRSADLVTVQAADGGEVMVQLLRDVDIDASSYIEVVGKVMDATTVKMMSVIHLGPDLDMKLVNDTIELIHDPRFYTRMFT
ncbi:putative replication factor A protein 3 [Lyophyllum shimeji]|uniref:Replication factor A protein 3 n=1 Tax=Lyophyllum shimeji TaxID=47721 RepID=A0A9P3PVA5_LYOSH|nr:putative replication factor A protein 3 [Lyophyllum shimeji]